MQRPSEYLSRFEDVVISWIRDLLFRKDALLPFKDGRRVYQYEPRAFTQWLIDWHWKIKKALRKKEDFSFCDFEIVGASSYRDSTNMSFDGYIAKHGAIQSPIDGSLHSSKGSYLEHLRKNDCVVSDWGKGTNHKEAPKISKRQVREAFYKAMQNIQN